MISLAQIQACLCAALSPFRNDQELEAAAALIRPQGTLDNTARLRIYQRNISGAHLATLELIYPVCREILGERVFATLAREYTWLNPTVDPNLNHYGVDFPEFLGKRVSASAELPYLHDLALLEYCWHKAWFEPNDSPFDFAAFAKNSKHTERLVFLLSQSLTLLFSEWPVHKLWCSHRDGEAPREIGASSSQDRLVIVRVGLEVEVNRISSEDYALLEAIIQGHTLTQLSVNPSLQGAMHRLPDFISRGWICGFQLLELQTVRLSVQ